MKIIKIFRIPLPVLLSLAVLGVLGLHVFVEYHLVTPFARETAVLSQQLKLHRIRADESNSLSMQTLSSVAEAPTTARVDEILTRLSNQEINSVRIERIHQLASEHRVVVRQASYLDKSTSGKIASREVQANLVGTYPDIRYFLREVLLKDEAIALESVELSRSANGNGVQAQVRFILYSRSVS